MSASIRSPARKTQLTNLANVVLEILQYTGAGIDTDLVALAYTWQRANERACKESALKEQSASPDVRRIQGFLPPPYSRRLRLSNSKLKYTS